MTGDFNSHSRLWGYANDDERGRLLLQQMACLHLISLNDPHCKPTFESSHLKGWPDLTLSSLSLFGDIQSWYVEDDMIYGDHRLITTSMKLTIEKQAKRRYRTKNTSLVKLRQAFKEEFNIKNSIDFIEVQSKDDFNSTYDKFLQIVTSLCDKFLKKKQSTYVPTISWWTSDLKIERNKTKALYRKTKLLNADQDIIMKYKRQRAHYKRKILAAKNKAWTDFCINSRDPYGKIKKTAFRDFHRAEISTIEDTLDEKGTTKLSHYKKLTSIIFGESIIPTPEKEITIGRIVPQFTFQEIKKALYSFNPNKAPGPDNMDHIIIRLLFKANGKLLRNMFNKLLSLNYFPQAWKIGEMVFFQKKGRDPTSSSSYRPITLLPILGKIYEKLLLRRINYQLRSSQKIERSQFGFLENKSTENAIAELFSIIDIRIENYKYTSLITLDIHHAFDSLNWNKTLEELTFLEIEDTYNNSIGSFLSFRRALPYWQADYVHWFHKGCPQGSCLGPFLWRVLLNSLLRFLKAEDCHVIAFADDIILIVSGNSRRELENKANKILISIEKWMNENKLTIATSKSQALHLRKPFFLKRPPIFKYNNQTIVNSTKIKYLGIIIDNKLSFLDHLRSKRQEIDQTLQNLFKFASAYGGLRKSILKIWYNNILEKKVTYAVSVWFSKLQRSHGSRLIASIHYSCLLWISRAYNRTSYQALCTLTGIMPLEIKMNKIATDGQVIRLGKVAFGLDPMHIQVKTSSYNVIPYINYFNSYTNQIPSDIDIYTDGSKIDDNCGYAFCVFFKKILLYVHQVKLNRENSIFQAEIEAISDAIDWSNNSIFETFTIHSDSKSSLDSLKDIFSNNLLISNCINKLQKTRKRIRFNWVKAHIGIYGNELADSKAKEAALDETLPCKFLPFPTSYVKKKTKEDAIKNWQLQWDTVDTGRYTYNLKPKVEEDFLLNHRNLYIMATDHGPFPSYLSKINKAPSSYCTCGKLGDSLHYILECPLTQLYHIKKSRLIPIDHWFKLITQTECLSTKIIECVRIIENNEFIFQGIGPIP